MKIFLFTMALFVAIQANALDKCIDITGVYKFDEVTAMRFTQNSCIGLKIEFGQIESTGKINWYKIPLRSLLNGSPICDTFGCVTGNVSEKMITLARDKAWAAYDRQHGDCSYNSENYSFSKEGVLIRKQNVYDCRDGYAGLIENTLTPIK